MAFQGPLWINIILGGLLTWRAMMGTSHYYSMASIFYGEFIMKTHPTPMSWSWTIINGIIDYSLYSLVWPGVRKFITGHLWLRLRWGFKETEIVFRKPTGWRRGLLNGLSPEEFQRQYTDILYRAIDPKLVFENTGYLTRSDYWALEYNAVGDAYSLMAAGELDIKTWDLSVWTREGGEWNVWEVWRLHDKQSLETIVGIVVEKLKAMGKEDIIQQWQSMSVSGAPVTTQSSGAIMDLFQREGINFEELWVGAVNEAAAIATGGGPVNN